MRPILFELTVPWLPAPVPIHAYGMMLGLSFTLGAYVYLYALRRHGLYVRHVPVAIAISVVGALVGARLLYVLANLDEVWTPARVIAAGGGGLVAYGGYIGGILSGGGYLRARGCALMPHVDACAPSFALGLALTRLGCFFNGCCYGAPTDGATGVRYPRGSVAFSEHWGRGLVPRGAVHTAPLHPIPLYEAALGVLLVAACAWLLARQRVERLARHRALATGSPPPPGALPDGSVFVALVAAYSGWRLLIESWRDDIHRGAIAAVSTSQLISLVLLLGCLLWVGRRSAARGASRLAVRNADGRAA